MNSSGFQFKTRFVFTYPTQKKNEYIQTRKRKGDAHMNKRVKHREPPPHPSRRTATRALVTSTNYSANRHRGNNTCQTRKKDESGDKNKMSRRKHHQQVIPSGFNQHERHLTQAELTSRYKKSRAHVTPPQLYMLQDRQSIYSLKKSRTLVPKNRNNRITRTRRHN
jgi:hypothetical protein